MSEDTSKKDYWNDRYKTQSTGWDIGYPSTPLKSYIDSLENKDLYILIPGAGNAYEAEYLWQQGFTNTHIIDIAPEVTEAFAKRVPDFPKENIFTEDFFKHDRKYDLILEQTFFCALPPSWRPKHVEQMHSLLKTNGRLAGVLFDFPLTEKGPPFGGSEEEYRALMSPKFEIRTMERCANSIPPRQGNELFFELIKRS